MTTNADTDGDGISDLAEIQQGLNPLGQRPLATGVVGNLPLQGSANDVVVESSTTNSEDQLAYVATTSGLAVVDISQFQRPIVVSQLQLPGNAIDIAVDSRLGIAALTTDSGGLHLVDVSNPANPRLSRNLALGRGFLEVADGVAYVAVASTIHAIDLVGGTELSRFSYVGGTIDDIAIAGGGIYTVSHSSFVPHTVHKIIADPYLAEPIATAVIDGHPTFGRLRITAADGRIYVGASDQSLTGQVPGVEVIEDRGDSLVLVGPPSAITAFDIAVNGSGLGLYTGATPGLESTAQLAILDLRDPTKTDRVVTFFDTPGVARAVTIAAGIGFVADGPGGLTVVNYLPFDNRGQAPQVSISAAVTDVDPQKPGIQVREGTSILVQPTVSDDVQVRNVELLVDGRVVRNDVSAPFDFVATAPNITPSAISFTIQVRATDTGGNSTLSNALSIELIEDTVPPTVVQTSPRNGAFAPDVAAISVTFSEPIDPANFNVAGITLTSFGPDGVEGGGDDSVLPLSRVSLSSSRRLVALTNNPLPLGNYRVTVSPGIVTDPAGNRLAQSYSFTFTSFEALPNTVYWVGGDGDWNDAPNWSSGTIPRSDQDVVIDRPGVAVTVTHSTGTHTVANLRSAESLVLTGGVLTNSGTSFVTGSLAVSGGTLVSSGDLVITGPLSTSGGTLRVDGNAARFRATRPTELSSANLLAFNGGQMEFPAATSYAGSAGVLGSMISANGTGSRIDLSNLRTLTDAGSGTTTLEAKNGGALVVAGVISGSPAVEIAVDGSNSVLNADSVTSMDGVNLRARNGGRLAFPRVNSYTGASSFDFNTISATGPGSRIDLSTLQSLHDPGGNTITLEARNGGTLLLAGTISGNPPVEIVVDGSDSVVNADQVTSIDGANLQANNGGQLVFPRVTSYTGSTNFVFNTISASGPGSRIDLSTLQSLHDPGGSTTTLEAGSGGTLVLAGTISGNPPVEIKIDGPTSAINAELVTSIDGANLQANNGGQLVFPRVTSYTGSTNFVFNTITASGPGSRIDLSTLQSLHDPGGATTILEAKSGGTLVLAGTISGNPPVEIKIDGSTSVINVDLVTSIDGANLLANNGGQLVFPRVTSYTGATNFVFNTISASEPGSRIDLSTLQSLHDPGGSSTNLEAKSGGTLVLAGAISGNVAWMADGGTSLIDARGVTSLPGSSITANGGGTVRLAEQGVVSLDGTVTSNVGSSLTASHIALSPTAIMSGNGTIVANLTNAGRIRPGSNLGTTAGQFTINGTFTQTSTGRLEIDLHGAAASAHDVLVVNGPATLDGTLAVGRPTGYLPSAGDAFPVLTFSSRTGDFASVSGLSLPNGLVLNRSFSPVNLVVTAARPLLASAAAVHNSPDSLASDQLLVLHDASLAIWAQAGLASGALDRLRSAELVVVDLPDLVLASAAGRVITIDRNAAGHGWFVDATPGSDEEFSVAPCESDYIAKSGTPADGRIDLLTAVLHEQAHLLGLEHAEDFPLLPPSLAPGIRRKLAPTLVDQVLARGWK
ncbi:MAG: Ig-like domain-containing protein [Pirellulaceae bacterium]